jgi:hypothetical protein
MACPEHLTEKPCRGRGLTRGTQHESPCGARGIHRPIQRMPRLFDVDGRLVNPRRVRGNVASRATALVEWGGIALPPAEHRRMRHMETPRQHEFCHVAIAQGRAPVPPDATPEDCRFEVTPCTRGGAAQRQAPVLWGKDDMPLGPAHRLFLQQCPIPRAPQPSLWRLAMRGDTLHH